MIRFVLGKFETKLLIDSDIIICHNCHRMAYNLWRYIVKNQAPEYSYKVGNVCRDPEERITQKGKTFYVFDLAIHHKNDITEFMGVSSWNNSVRKGDFIKVDGPVGMYKKQNGDLKPWMNALHIIVLRKAPAPQCVAESNGAYADGGIED